MPASCLSVSLRYFVPLCIVVKERSNRRYYPFTLLDGGNLLCLLNCVVDENKLAGVAISVGCKLSSKGRKYCKYTNKPGRTMVNH
jgi:hypothetical protein